MEKLVFLPGFGASPTLRMRPTFRQSILVYVVVIEVPRRTQLKLTVKSKPLRTSYYFCARRLHTKSWGEDYLDERPPRRTDSVPHETFA